MNRRSIRARLTVWYTAVLSLALLVFGLGTWFLLRHFLYSDLRDNVRNQSEGLATYLNIEDRDAQAQLSVETEEYSRSLQQVHLIAVFEPSGRLLWANWADPQRVLPAEPGKPFVIHGPGHQFLGMLRSVRLQHGEYRTFIAIAADPVARVSDLLGLVLAGMVPCFVFLGAAGGFWISRKALAPVDGITQKVRDFGWHDLSARLPVPDTGDELERLASAWNETLTRLERAVTEVRQFTADASHELRTPAAIIRLAAEQALRRERTPQEYQNALQKIQTEAERMSVLMENLLFLARSDASQGVGPGEPVVVNELVRRVVDEMSPLAEAKQIGLAAELSEEQLVGRVEPGALRRILVILIENAIRYTPRCGIVSVKAEHNRGTISVTVADNGPGIPEEFRDRVFERFFRLDAARSKQSGGYGLGLAIAQTLAKRCGGDIGVRPNPGGGGGSTFILHLVRCDVVVASQPDGAAVSADSL